MSDVDGFIHLLQAQIYSGVHSNCRVLAADALTCGMMRHLLLDQFRRPLRDK